MERPNETLPSHESKPKDPTQEANEFMSRWKRGLLDNLDKIYLAGAALNALASAGFALSGNIPLTVVFGSLAVVELIKAHATK